MPLRGPAARLRLRAGRLPDAPTTWRRCARRTRASSTPRPARCTVTNSYGAFPSGIHARVRRPLTARSVSPPAASRWSPLTEVADAQTGDIAGLTAYNNAHEITLDDGSIPELLGHRLGRSRSPWLSATQSVRVGAAVTLQQPVILDYRNDLWNIQPPDPVVGAGDGRRHVRARPGPPNAVPATGGRRPQARHLQRAQLLQHHRCRTSTRGPAPPARTSATAPATRCTVEQLQPDDGPRGAARARRLRAPAGQDRHRDQHAWTPTSSSLEEIENSVEASARPTATTRSPRWSRALNADAGHHALGVRALAAGGDLPPTGRAGRHPHRVHLQPRHGRARRCLQGPRRLRGVRQRARAAGPGVQGRWARDDADAFAVIVNHFKSKGSACRRRRPAQGNCQPGPGQRRRQALAAFADAVPPPSAASTRCS